MKKQVRTRLRVLALGIFLVAALIVLRLYFVQIVHGEEYELRADRQYVSASQELFDRGSIFFSRKDNTPISAATLATGFVISIQPAKVVDASATYESINAITPIDRAVYDKAVSRTEDPYEVLARKVPDDEGRRVSALALPGVSVTRERWRIYPAEHNAAQTIGFISYNNENVIAGQYGLERYYNDVLSRNNTGLFGNFFAELFANLDSVVVDASGAREGDLITSIEPVVQKKLDDVLRNVQARYGSTETGAIIMDPTTGEIIALSTMPTFNADRFVEENPLYFGNPLVEHQYEFGSIVKALTMASGLDAGVVTADSTYNDTGCQTVNKKTFCNHDFRTRGARGTTSMQQLLSDSLNIGAAYIATSLGHERFRSYFMRLGFGEETGIDLPSEVAGNIENIKKSPRDIEYNTASFGQGIAETPVQMIKALGALANHGAIVTPHVVRAIKLENGIEKKLSWGGEERVFSASSVDTTTRMLVKIVDEKIAGGKMKIPEMSVAAKTGTAQIAGPGGKYVEGQYFHSFFGYFPAYEPRYIILLYTKQPSGVQYASETLTEPFFELTHFLINYYAIPPDRPES